MPEPIGEYRGLVINWAGGRPKGDYPSEAYAHAAELGADYYDHEWKDLAILESDLDQLRAEIEQDDGTMIESEAEFKILFVGGTLARAKPRSENITRRRDTLPPSAARRFHTRRLHANAGSRITAGVW